MSRHGRLFVGRIARSVRTRDLEDIFQPYGRVIRCDIKYTSSDLAFAFVDFDDKQDAADAIRYEDGRELRGARIVVEWAKGTPHASDADRYDYDGGRDRDRRSGGGRGRSPPRRRRSSPPRRSRSRDRRRSRSRSPDRRRRDSRQSRSPPPREGDDKELSGSPPKENGDVADD